MAFTRAERQRVWLKMAITGPSGSGKTYSALRLGFGLGTRVALVDTENGSASLYADLGAFDTQPIASPYTVKKYTDAIWDAVDAGYDVLIIDSLTHAWAGDGGLMDQKTARDSRGGNSFTNWGEITKIYEQFKTALLQSPIHIIGTMRSKQDYVIETDSRGKSAPRKVGMAPIQRDGFEYEFTTVLDVDMSHIASTSKDRTGLFTDEISQITEGHGKRLADWLAGGAAPKPVPVPVSAPEPVQRPVNEFPSQRQKAAAVYEDVATYEGDEFEDGYGTEKAAAPSVSPRSTAPASPQTHTDANGLALACVGEGGCGKALTRAQSELSNRHYGESLCPGCQKNRSRVAVAA